MQCGICLHRCDLKLYHIGKCSVYKNTNGKLINQFANQVSVLSVESTEKRPFYHYDQGSKYLGVGFLGCSFSCPNCSNYQISQNLDYPVTYIEPSEIVSLAKQKFVRGIAFSYNEPTLYYDYICETGRLKCDLHVVVKTNGFATPETFEKMNTFVDAYNIDIKGYQYINDIIKNINCVLSAGIHLEISYLVTDSLIDDHIFHGLLMDLLPDVPLHLLYCYPCHLYEDSYNKDKLISLKYFFSQKFKNVYLSNLF